MNKHIRFTTKRSVPKTIRFLSGDGQYQYGHLGFRTRQEADAFESMVANYDDAVKALELVVRDCALPAQAPVAYTNAMEEALALLQRIQGDGERFCECFGDSGLHASTHIRSDNRECCDMCGWPVQPDSTDVLTAVNAATTTGGE